MKKLIVLTLSIIAVIAACKNPEEGFITSESGIKYKIHRTNDTAHQIVYDEVVTFYLKVRDIDGNMMINTVDSNKGNPGDVLLKDMGDTSVMKVFEMFTYLKEGDSATFILTAPQFFGPKMGDLPYPAGIKDDQKLLIDIGVKRVIPLDTLKKGALELELKNAENKRIRDSTVNSKQDIEAKGMAEYFKKKGLSNVKTLDSGVMIAITKHGNGPKAETGDAVTVEFDIKTLVGADVMNTKKQGKPYTFANLGIAVVGEVYGLHDAIAQMSEGGEATIAIPFRRGFGDRPMSEDIPEYSTLVGTIKITKVEKK